MEYNLEALNWISGYDLTNKEIMLKQEIISVSIISDVSDDWKPRLYIYKLDGKEESYVIDYEPYYQYLRLKKIQKIINNFGIK